MHVHDYIGSALSLCSMHHLDVFLQVDRQLQHLRSRLDQMSPQHSDASVLAEQVRCSSEVHGPARLKSQTSKPVALLSRIYTQLWALGCSQGLTLSGHAPLGVLGLDVLLMGGCQHPGLYNTLDTMFQLALAHMKCQLFVLWDIGPRNTHISWVSAG